MSLARVSKTPIILLGLLLAVTVSANASGEDDWTVVTMATGGSWGVATASSQSQALAAAIRKCKLMSPTSSDCGAEFTTIRAGWTIGESCGDYKFIVADRTLADAEKAAMFREIDLRLFYVPDLPTCKRVLMVDPTGAIVSSAAQHSVEFDGWRE